jgi:hypothetical protein
MAGLVSGGSFNAQRQGSSCGLEILGCEAGMEGIKAALVKGSVWGRTRSLGTEHGIRHLVSYDPYDP